MSDTNPISEEDYDAIEAAVMETARGRWFLAEYARRNRTADTRMLLTAIKRVEDSLSAQLLAQKESEAIRAELVEMGTAIARTRKEIAALKPEGGEGGLYTATDELEGIVKHTEKATGEILSTAEQIQEIAWTLREAKVDEEICAKLDGYATDIYIACSFQDLTGQRTARVVEALQVLEKRINSMVDIWYLEEEIEPDFDDVVFVDHDELLLNGPDENGLKQDSIDVLIDDTAAFQRANSQEYQQLDCDVEEQDVVFDDGEDLPAGGDDIHAMVEAAQDAQMSIAEDRQDQASENKALSSEQDDADALDPDALSDGHKAALFS